MIFAQELWTETTHLCSTITVTLLFYSKELRITANDSEVLSSEQIASRKLNGS